MVPLLDINAQNLPLQSELTSAFTRVLASGQFILGPEVATLENELARMVGVPHGIGVSSGTDAILLALMALGVGAGDEVLCPAFTFFATAGCVSRLGAVPVFVDVDLATFNIDLHDAERKITPRTRGIIPVHLFGQCAEMEGLTRLAEENHLFILEDAAQSLGAQYQKRQAGSFGIFGAFSFYPTKNLGGLGDGGLLVCRDADLAARARTLRNHGAERTYYHQYVGGNFRLDGLQAAFLRVKLPYYDTYTARRAENAAYYTEKLSKLPGVVLGPEAAGDKDARLILPSVARDCGHIWNQYTVRVPGQRDAFRTFLNERSIQTGVYYPVPLNRQECFAPYGQANGCPKAAQLAEEVASLPIYAELTEEQLTEVVGAVSAFLKRDSR